MRPPLKLRNFFEQYFPDILSYALETKRKGEDGKLEGWKVESRWKDTIDPATCSQTVLDAALEFLEECPKCPYRALIRVPKEVSPDGRLRGEFAIPGGGAMNAYPINVAEMMAAQPDDDGEGNGGGSAAIMTFVLAHAQADSDKAEAQLEAAREREGQLMETVVEMIGQTRETSIEFIKETRKDRESHDLRMEPVLQVSIDTLRAAAELVKIHNESNTTVQLAKLEYEAEEKKWEMYVGIGGPVIKDMMKRFSKRKRNQKQVQATMPIETKQEDKEPTHRGPTRTLFLIIEKLSDEQVEQVKSILPEGMFQRLDNAAHSDDDGQTTVALGELKSEYEKLGKMKGLAKMLELGEVLGEDLGEQFIGLFTDDEDGDDDDAEPVDAEVIQLRKKAGYVAGLSGFGKLSDGDMERVGEQFGAGLAGALIAAAEGDDEDNAFVAVCTLSSRLKQLSEETSEEEAQERMASVMEVIGDTEGTLMALICRAIDEVDPST